jgi:hypothetical protein
LLFRVAGLAHLSPPADRCLDDIHESFTQRCVLNVLLPETISFAKVYNLDDRTWTSQIFCGRGESNGITGVEECRCMREPVPGRSVRPTRL